jgi:hypothetical protein
MYNWQEYQHIGKTQKRITIVKDVAPATNIAKTILLAATMRKYPKIDLEKQDLKTHI